jgi:hypothetical protein
VAEFLSRSESLLLAEAGFMSTLTAESFAKAGLSILGRGGDASWMHPTEESGGFEGPGGNCEAREALRSFQERPCNSPRHDVTSTHFARTCPLSLPSLLSRRAVHSLAGAKTFGILLISMCGCMRTYVNVCSHVTAPVAVLFLRSSKLV